MGNKQYYKYFRDPDRKLQKWWRDLQGIGENAKNTNRRGERAILRRAESPADVMLSSVYYELCNLLLPKFHKNENAVALAITAGILSHVEKEDINITFAAQLGTSKEGGVRPVMSELRFQQLAKSSNPDEFYHRLVRAIRLLGKTANIMSLTDNIFHWVNEHKFGKDQNPEKRLVIQWASDYFQAISKIKK